MKTKSWKITVIAGIGLTGGAILFSPNLTADMMTQAAPAKSVTTENLRRSVVVTEVQYERAKYTERLPGTIAAEVETVLGFRVGGKLEARLVDLGDMVQKGQVIARLDATDLTLQLDAAKAEEIVARIALEKATINLDRVNSLQEQGFASGRASDDETVAVEEAQSRFMRARRSVELASRQLDYATLRADADGVVTAELAEAGQVVALGQPVVRVADHGSPEAMVAIPESMIADIRHADAEVELWSSASEKIPATLKQLSPIADKSTRTFEARYTLDDPEGLAMLGMSATVLLSRQDEQPTVKLPLSALLYGRDDVSVWVIDKEDHVQSRSVTVVNLGADSAWIGAGLSGGERVVVLGSHKLTNGEIVTQIQRGK